MPRKLVALVARTWRDEAPQSDLQGKKRLTGTEIRKLPATTEGAAEFVAIAAQFN